MPALDGFNLERFVRAQATCYEQVCAELAEGEKRSHWMWFIFPQIRGLGYSATARQFAISGLPEAAAYLQHPVLGPRLRECTSLVNAVERRSLAEVFGYPDDLKFHSSMTLFAAAGENSVFTAALEKYFRGRGDARTVAELEDRTFS